MAEKNKVRVRVLVKAKEIVTEPPKPAPTAKSKKPTAREKVIRGLQKLHPMD